MEFFRLFPWKLSKIIKIIVNKIQLLTFNNSFNVFFGIFQVIAPWRMKEFIKKFEGRPDLLKYAAENNISVSATPKDPWSMDANLMHISYESGILENPAHEPREKMFQMTANLEQAPNNPVRFEIEFKKGIPIWVKYGECLYKDPLQIFSFLNRLGGKHGVGRIDIVENRFIGLKVSYPQNFLANTCCSYKLNELYF